MDTTLSQPLHSLIKIITNFLADKNAQDFDWSFIGRVYSVKFVERRLFVIDVLDDAIMTVDLSGIDPVVKYMSVMHYHDGEWVDGDDTTLPKILADINLAISTYSR